MQRPENFRSLAALLRPQPATLPPAQEIVPLPDERAVHDVDAVFEAKVDLVREVRLFQARLIEASHVAVQRLLGEVAREVLARELELAPADIQAIVARALRRAACREPLRIRVHPDDAARLSGEVPVACDAFLERGDAVIDLHDGTLDASIAVRLACVLQALAP